MRPVCALLLICGGSAEAEEVSISLDQALTAAERLDPTLLRARREVTVLRAARPQATQLLPTNPALSFYAGARRDASASSPAAQGFEWGLRVEQQMGIAGQRGARIAEFDSVVAAAMVRERVARLRARLLLRETYLAAQLAEAQLFSAQRREQLGEQLYQSARARATAGAASDVELHLAEVERGRLVHERVEAESALLLAQHKLALLCGLSPHAQIKLTTPLARPGLPSESLEQLLSAALSRRLEWTLLEAHRAELSARLARLSRELVPSPILSVDVAQAQPGQLYTGGGLGFELPLWRRNQGERASVRAAQSGLSSEHELLRREIEHQVVLAHSSARLRLRDLDAWESQVVPSAEANVELVSRGWRAGKFDLFRVIAVEREAGEARRRLLEIMSELWQAALLLDQARGAL